MTYTIHENNNKNPNSVFNIAPTINFGIIKQMTIFYGDSKETLQNLRNKPCRDNAFK